MINKVREVIRDVTLEDAIKILRKFEGLCDLYTTSTLNRYDVVIFCKYLN